MSYVYAICLLTYFYPSALVIPLYSNHCGYRLSSALPPPPLPSKMSSHSDCILSWKVWVIVHLLFLGHLIQWKLHAFFPLLFVQLVFCDFLLRTPFPSLPLSSWHTCESLLCSTSHPFINLDRLLLSCPLLSFVCVMVNKHILSCLPSCSFSHTCFYPLSFSHAFFFYAWEPHNWCVFRSRLC